jgi:lysophospholipase L1-like esterase
MRTPRLLPSRLAARVFVAVMALATTVAADPWDFWAHNAMRRVQIEREVLSLTADTTSTVVLLGDSITEGHPVRTLGGYRVVNQGISGDVTDSGTTVSGLASRLEFVRRARPAHVFLMAGINDLGSSKPVDRLEKDYAALVDRLRILVPDATIHLQSILPTGQGLAHLNAGVVETNLRICRIARDRGLDYMDLHALLKDERGELRAECTDHGLHLVKPGYDIWTRVLEQTMAGR